FLVAAGLRCVHLCSSVVSFCNVYADENSFQLSGGCVMLRLLLLSLGGALGTAARYGVNGLISEWQYHAWSAVFPLGTLIVNVSGCFAIGFLAAVSGPSMGRMWFSPEWRDFLMIGFCGGYTTFSSYGLQ